MKIKFKKPKMLKKNKPEKNISYVKKMIKRLPETQRMQIASQMWLGTSLTNTPTILKPFMRMFEDANNLAAGKVWEKIIKQTEEFILNPSTLTTNYKNKLLKMYKKEPTNLKKLTEFFKQDCKNMSWFKSFIPKDLKESENREFKQHVDFWLNDIPIKE